MTVRFYKDDLPGTGHREDWCDFPAGQTIESTLGTTEMRAWVNGREVDATFMRTARLKDGLEVHVEPIPRDPVSLSIAATVAATAAGVTGGVTAIALTALSVALAAGSSLMAQKEAKNKGSNRGSFDRLNSITGTRNNIASFEAVPRLFGRMRYFPPIPMTAQPYTELKGDKQYYRMLFCLGYGPLDLGGHIVGEGYDKITQDASLGKVLGQPVIRIGDTDINEYDDLEYEIGSPDQMTLYTDQVLQTEPNWSTESDASDYGSHSNPTVEDGLSTVRTTDTNATGFSIDIAGQLYTSDTNGKFKKLRIQWMVEWRISGSDDSWDSDTFAQASDGTKTSRVNYSQEGLPSGQYDVRLTRISTYFSNLEGPPSSKATWTALRTLRDTRAFTMPGTVTMAVKILATDQLKGTIDKLSVLPVSVLDVYDTDSQSWEKRPTRTHAWAFASVMTDQANRQPIDKDDLDLRSLLAWEAETEAAGRHYDVVYDDNGTTIERMNDICAGGRANWTINPDTSLRIVLDTVQSVPKMLISPYNSFGYSYTMNAFDPPHAVKMRYIDTTTWQNTERTVYDDGYDVSNATIFETVDASGCTDADQAYKDGRRYLAKRRLRDIESHQFSQDIQHYKYGVGDMLELANEVILVSLGYGRLNKVVVDDDGRATEVVANTFLEMEHPDTQYGIKIHRMDGSVVTVRVENDTPGNDRLKIVNDGQTDLTGIEPDCHFVFGESGKVTTDIKVDTVTPKGDIAQITAVPAAPQILDAEDGDIPAPVDDISLPPDPADTTPPPPTIGDPISDASVAIQNDDGSLTYRIAVPVTANSGRVPTDHIDVQVKGEGALTYDTQTAQDGTAYFTGYNPGETVTIRARAFGDNGKASKFALYGQYQVTGRQPQPPTGLNVTPHTLSADLDPIGGKPGSKYVFMLSGSSLDPDDVKANATRLNDQPASTYTITGRLSPDTVYYAHAYTVTLYGESSVVSQQFRTRNDASALLKAVNGRITKTELDQALRGEIELITPPDSIQSMIDDRVTTEQQARIDAIDQTYTDFKAGDTGTLSEAKTYADEDSQAAQDVKALVANLGGNAASALSYTLTQVEQNSTLATRVNQLEADYGDLNNAQISDNAQAISDAKGSAASLAESLDTRFANKADSADLNSKASISYVENAKSDVESSIAQSRTEIETDYNAKLDDKADQSALSTKASLTYVDNAVSDESSARATQYDGIQADLSGKADTNASGQVLQNGQVLVSAGSGPFASATRQVSISDGDSTATVEQQLTSQRSDIGGLRAQYAVKIDSGGRISGFGLSSEPAEDGSPRSQFIIRADMFALGDPDGDTTLDYPFVFVDGQLLIHEANIGSLTFTKLKDASGNFIVNASGQIDAKYIRTDQLVVGYDQIDGSKPPIDADRTRDNEAASVAGQGALATRDDVLWNGMVVGEGRPTDYADRTADNVSKSTLAVGEVPAELLERDDVWSKTYSVDTNDTKWLRSKNGRRLAPSNDNADNTYIAIATTLGTSTTTRTVGRFRIAGGTWTCEIVSSLGTGNNHPEFFLDNGLPAVRLYNYSGNYNVEVTVLKGLSSLSAKDVADFKNDVSGPEKPADYADVTEQNTANDVHTGSSRAVHERGANNTESRTAGDVQTGSGKAVRQRGADKTSENKSADTDQVGGYSAGYIKDQADNAQSTYFKTNDWTRTGTTLIDGGSIYADDAFIVRAMMKKAIVGTLEVEGGALTLLSSYEDDNEFGNFTNGGYNDKFAVKIPGSRIKNSSAQVVVVFRYRARGNSSAKLTARLVRDGNVIREQMINYQDSGSIGGIGVIVGNDFGLTPGDTPRYSAEYMFETYGGDEFQTISHQTISFQGLWNNA